MSVAHPAPREDEPPYTRYAFVNPYNLSVFGGLVATGLLTGHHWVTILACAGEVLWLIFAPDSTILRRLWFDPAFARAARLEDAERCRAKAEGLAPPDRGRAAALVRQQEAIGRLSRENPSLAVELLQLELGKLHQLVEDFVDLGVTAARAETHASAFDFGALRASWRVHAETAQRYPAGDPRRSVAEKNLDVLRQRSARYDDLCRTSQLARGQMELIEHTFQLLGDEILTMASPRELGGRIEELRVAVDAVRETAEETYPVIYEDGASVMGARS